MESFITSSVNWRVCSNNCGISLLRNEIIPKKRCKYCLDLGKGISLVVLTFSGFGEVIFPDILCPKNIGSVAPNTRLSWSNFKCDFRILFKTCSVRISNWFRFDTNIVISSWLFLASSQPSHVSVCGCWFIFTSWHHVMFAKLGFDA